MQAGPSSASVATGAVVVCIATTDAGGLTFTRAFDITVTETTNVTALDIIAAALTVVVGFTSRTVVAEPANSRVHVAKRA